jgi:SEC-C motif-containing protein
MNLVELNNCHCATEMSYAQCCEPFHNGTDFPRTAQTLMRSRYSAYVVKDADYLLSTWHKTTRPNEIDFSNDKTMWQKLVILHTKKGGVNDDKGRVEFNAFYVQDGEDRLIHEISRFKKISGRWFYMDGVLD